MKMKLFFLPKLSLLPGLLLFTHTLFAAVPIRDSGLTGAAAANARLKLLKTAESFLGTPYRYAGLDRKGLDCSGLVHLAFREGLGRIIPRSSAAIYDWSEKISTTELQPGDLVFFVTSGQKVSHLGIYAGGGKFIHAASDGPKTGVIYSRMDENYWKRTYKGAGRALPWDSGAARAMASAFNSTPSGARPEAGASVSPAAGSSSSKKPAPVKASTASPVWTDSGYFAGFGAAWSWGGFFEGAPSIFRGIAGHAAVGYKWSVYQAGLEFRFALDRALGVFRVPVALSIGSDNFRFFGGPAYTFGDPGLSLEDGERNYSGGGEWLWEAGFYAALPPIKIGRGALSPFAELAWQAYHWEEGEKFTFKPDVTANIRFSTGFRYSFVF